MIVCTVIMSMELRRKQTKKTAKNPYTDPKQPSWAVHNFMLVFV